MRVDFASSLRVEFREAMGYHIDLHQLAVLSRWEPELSFQKSEDSLMLQWDRGRLYQSSDLTNGWQLMEDTFSPHELQPLQQRSFFRLEY